MAGRRGIIPVYPRFESPLFFCRVIISHLLTNLFDSPIWCSPIHQLGYVLNEAPHLPSLSTSTSKKAYIHLPPSYIVCQSGEESKEADPNAGVEEGAPLLPSMMGGFMGGTMCLVYACFIDRWVVIFDAITCFFRLIW